MTITAIDYESNGYIKHQESYSKYSDSVLILGDLGILDIKELSDLDYFVINEENYLKNYP